MPSLAYRGRDQAQGGKRGAGGGDMKKRSSKAAIKSGCVIVRRVSDARQVQNDSLEDQERRLNKWAANEDLQVLALYTDPGVTAKTMHRPAPQKVLAFCNAYRNKLACVLFTDYSRTMRNTMHYYAYKYFLSETGVKLRIEQLKEYEGAPQLPYIEGLFVNTAEADNTEMAGLTKVIQPARFQEGKRTCQPPLGYLNGMAIDPVKSPLIKLAFKSTARGKTISKILELLEKRGLRTRRSNKPVSRADLHRILRNPIYEGVNVVSFGRVANKTEGAPMDVRQAPGNWTPLVDMSLFQKVQDLLQNKGRVVYETREEHFPLRGYLYCRACGSFWASGRSTSRRRSALLRCACRT